VDLATEFTNLITTQRAYSASTRVITTASEMLDTLNNMH
jgi:flagellar hook protein FlgE